MGELISGTWCAILAGGLHAACAIRPAHCEKPVPRVHNDTMPAFMIVVAAIVSLAAIFGMADTYRQKL